MPKSRRYGTKWHVCARCGFTYPELLISLNPLRKWICIYCWDENEGEIA